LSGNFSKEEEEEEEEKRVMTRMHGSIIYSVALSDLNNARIVQKLGFSFI
jgi:hypothetical protein